MHSGPEVQVKQSVLPAVSSHGQIHGFRLDGSAEKYVCCIITLYLMTPVTEFVITFFFGSRARANQVETERGA